MQHTAPVCQLSLDSAGQRRFDLLALVMPNNLIQRDTRLAANYHLLTMKQPAQQPTSGSASASASVAAVRYSACGSVRCTVNHPADVLPPRSTSCCCSSALAAAPCAATSRATPGWLPQAVRLQNPDETGAVIMLGQYITCSWSSRTPTARACCCPFRMVLWLAVETCKPHTLLPRRLNVCCNCWFHNLTGSEGDGHVVLQMARRSTGLAHASRCRLYLTQAVRGPT